MASLISGPNSSSVAFRGLAKVYEIDEDRETISVSNYGETIQRALNYKKTTTLEVGQTALSRGEATFDDIEVDDIVAIEFRMPQDSEPLYGFMWATDNDGQVKLIDHPETYTSPEES